MTAAFELPVSNELRYLFYRYLTQFDPSIPQCHMLISYSGLAVSANLVYLLYNPLSIVASVLYCCLLVLHGLWFCEVSSLF